MYEEYLTCNLAQDVNICGSSDYFKSWTCSAYSTEETTWTE